jgi:hypothetical protein
LAINKLSRHSFSFFKRGVRGQKASRVHGPHDFDADMSRDSPVDAIFDGPVDCNHVTVRDGYS